MFARRRCSEGVAARLRDAIQATSPLLRVSAMTPQSVLVGQTVLRERMLLLIAGFFAGVGLILVGVGVYGVLSYTVLERTREIGIRVALGARHLTVVRTMLADTGGAALIGIALGTLGGLYLSRFVQSLCSKCSPSLFAACCCRPERYSWPRPWPPSSRRGAPHVSTRAIALRHE